MTANDAMLIVAANLACMYGYIEVSRGTNNGKNDSFWGNRIYASTHSVSVEQCKYILPQFEGDKEAKGSSPRIEIDMHWCNPRLTVVKADGTLACITYNGNHVSEAQAFTDDGLYLALYLQQSINELIGR